MIIQALRLFYTKNRMTPVVVVLFPFLVVLSGIYLFGTACLKVFYRFFSYRSSFKIISIGNITLGGSGKTPLVEWLARHMSMQGHRVAVLLRGYKSSRDAMTPFVSLNYYVYGDEASMLKENLGLGVTVEVGRNRIQKIKTLRSQGDFDAIILDDGFQQWGLKRDLDIVTIDANRPFGNGLLLPAGQLRESINALKRADVLCLTRCYEGAFHGVQDITALLKKINPHAIIVETVHEPDYLYFLDPARFLAMESRIPLENLKDKDVALCCGIANPDSFLRTIESLGANVVSKNFFQDHHVFTKEELVKIKEDCQTRGIRRLIVTEKDAPRLIGAGTLFKHSSIEILVLKINLKIIKGREELDERLRALYRP